MIAKNSTVRCGSAPPSRPIPKSSATEMARSVESPKITSRQIPPKTPLQVHNVAFLVKKQRLPLPKRRNETKNCRNYNFSMAMSRTESILVSSAGDVIVCRCRRSSTPFIPPKARDPLDVWDKQFPCCDTELLSNIDGPWSPVLQNLTAEKNGRARTGSGSHISTNTEISAYEWEQNNHVSSSTTNTSSIFGLSGLKGGSLSSNNHQTLYDYVNANSSTGGRVGKKFERSSNNGSSTEGRNIELIGTAAKEEDSSSHNSSLDNNIGEDLILPLPSFDYSHIIDGYNDMITQTENKIQKIKIKNTSSHGKNTRQKRKQPKSMNPPTILESGTENKDSEQNDSILSLENEQKFFHGVPIFLSTLSQVRITKVSANPLGAHVLMISEEALLFTYGLNHRGQLGIGFKSEIKNKQRGFHTAPTLITPLLENGGKAINCAAGVDHSLVVVSTEGRRLQKLQTNPGVAHSDHYVESVRVPKSPYTTYLGGKHEFKNDEERVVDGRSHFPEKSVQYHQVYAFGRNNFMKLGLVRPHLNELNTEGDSAEDAVLPRRVGLHCTVWSQEGDSIDTSLPSQGVFDVAASTEHSSALVRRATGDIEVYMWGNASIGALGLPLNLRSQEIRCEIARKPSFKKKNITSLPSIVEKLCHRRNENPQSPFPTQVSLGPYCSFVVMSNGKCMSCGFSAEGMLGHGYNKTYSAEPSEVFLPQSENGSKSSSRIVSVSAGAFHALALTDDGNVYSWGINSNERLGLGVFDYSSLAPSISDKKENLVVTEWVPQRIDITSKKTTTNNSNHKPSKITTIDRVRLACAGYDSSLIVTESGQVLSFGKRSGRLGQGEISANVSTPQPLYGGLHLFHQRRKGKKNTAKQIHQRSISASG
mmetsp:Transcript_10427/g.11861  ORF Transcript_10427/g.11861 Transcript_10427/m.11861 type:complete len:875 (-) Transcript_10427:45-2669(-)